MEFLQFIHLNKGKIIQANGRQISYENLLKLTKNEKKLYIYDNDAIKQNKPNLKYYQKLSASNEIWLDANPRDLVDIIDYLTTGVEAIILRSGNSFKFNLNNIRDLSDINLYKNIDFNFYTNNIDQYNFSPKYNGFVFTDKNIFHYIDFKFEGFIKKLSMNNEVIVYESDPKNVIYWKKLNITKFIVPIEKIEEFKSHAF